MSFLSLSLFLSASNFALVISITTISQAHIAQSAKLWFFVPIFLYIVHTWQMVKFRWLVFGMIETRCIVKKNETSAICMRIKFKLDGGCFVSLYSLHIVPQLSNIFMVMTYCCWLPNAIAYHGKFKYSQ